MELFGRDINIDLDVRQQEWGFYIGTTLIVLILTYLFIVKPVNNIRTNQSLYKEEVAKNEETGKVLGNTEVKYDLQIAKYEEQKENYEKLKVKMENASVQNNAVLKEVVQKMLDYLNVKLVSIGAIQGSEEVVESYYEKKYIPYSLQGKGNDISNLFYYLENSEWLLTLKGSIINMTRSGSGEDERVSVNFRLGAYYPKETGGESEDVEETN